MTKNKTLHEFTWIYIEDMTYAKYSLLVQGGTRLGGGGGGGVY